MLLWPGSAAASCAAAAGGPPALTEYDHVFAGHVERVTDDGAAAEVTVLDVWHGPDLPPRVVVVGGQLAPGVASSVDRSYLDGEQYAFFLSRGADGSLRDSACTPTAPLSSLSGSDPPGRRLPQTTASAPTDPRGGLPRRGALAAGGAAAMAGATGVALVLRRGRQPRL